MTGSSLGKSSPQAWDVVCGVEELKANEAFAQAQGWKHSPAWNMTGLFF